MVSLSNIGGPASSDSRYKQKAETKPVDKPFEMEEVQKAKVKATTATESITSTTQVQKESSTISIQKPEIARSLSQSDLMDQLLEIKKTPTQENQLIIAALLEHGIEASESNFNAITRLLKGKGKTYDLESAVLSLSKGLEIVLVW